MMGDEFEWDDAKAARNKRDHKVSFETARAVFDDPNAIWFLDEYHGTDEERFLTVGMSGSGLLFVVHTQRNDRIRIISARSADYHEERRYNDGHRARFRRRPGND